MRGSQKHASFIAPIALILLTLTSACGREDKVYPDTSSEPTVVIDSQKHLPDGLFDHSVNRGLVRVGLDLPQTAVLALQTNAGTNEPGAFNGVGTGNRALLGLADFNEVQLSQLNPITFDSKTITGSEKITLLLQVDLECDSSDVRTLLATQTTLEPGLSESSDYTRYTADLLENKWQIQGDDLIDPVDAVTVLVAGTSSASTSSLAQFIVRYPNACIRNFVNTQTDFPKDLATSGVLFSLGSNTTSTQNSVLIRRITLGTDTFENLQWSTP